MPRADLYLRQAVAVLRTHAAFPRTASATHAWSSTYRPLSILLGDDLSKALRDAGELRNDFVYRPGGFVFDDDGRKKEHGVPMKCLVRHLLSTPALWTGPGAVARLREFLREHLLLVEIPGGLNDLLAPCTMPNDCWHLPVSATLGQREKDKLLWGRYLAVRGLRMHWQRGAHFQRR